MSENRNPSSNIIEDYRSLLSLRLDWSEMDLFGHINNVQYFKFVQASRVNLWEAMGYTSDYRKTGFGPMLASTNCEFLAPLFYPGKIEMRAAVTKIGNSSFHIEHLILNDANQICAVARDVVVHFDFTEHHSVAINEHLQSQLLKLSL